MKKIFKRLTAIILATVLCLSFVPLASAEGITVVLRGDVNGDGMVNSSDALLVLRNAVGHYDADFSDYWADLNGDGKINSTDALRILQISVGSDDPSKYSDEELLKFYSDALSMSCQDPMDISYYTCYESVMYNDYDETDFVEFYTEDEYTVNYVDGYDSYGDSAFDLCPATWIDIDDISSVTYEKDEYGYHCITITLKEEWTDYNNPVPEKTYKYTSTYSDCTVSGIDSLNVYNASGDFYETEITAYINPEGFVTALHILMPFYLYMSLEDVDGYHYADVTEYGYIYDSYYFYFE